MCILMAFTFLFKLKDTLLTKRPKRINNSSPAVVTAPVSGHNWRMTKLFSHPQLDSGGKKKPKRAETISDPAQSFAVKPDLFPCDSIMHLCRRGPRGRLLLQPCTGPGASLSCLMYVGVSRGPLPVGAGLPPEARLKRPRSLSCVCRLSNSLVYGLH